MNRGLIRGGAVFLLGLLLMFILNAFVGYVVILVSLFMILRALFEPSATDTTETAPAGRDVQITTGAGQTLSWPDECACCGSPATATVSTYPLRGNPRLRRVSTVQVPYCVICRKHVESEGKGAMTGWWLGTLGVLALVGMMFFLDPIPEFLQVITLPLMLVSFWGGILWGKRRGRTRAAGLTTPQCCSAKPAVLYLDRESGSLDRAKHTFTFRSDQYFRRFCAANQDHLR